jgi:hypothetical protein
LTNAFKSILEISLGLEYLLLSLFNGPLINLLEILLKADFLLNPIGRLLLIAKNNLNLILKQLFLIRLIGLGLNLGPNIQQFESILDGDFIVVGTAEHEELSEVEEVFGLGGGFVDGALFVHVYELFYADLFV